MATCAAFAIWQKSFVLSQRHKSPSHRGHVGHEAAAMHIANSVRRAGAAYRKIQQCVAVHHRDAPFAGRDGHQDADGHGRSRPAPRSNWAVSNSGRPTTPE